MMYRCISSYPPYKVGDLVSGEILRANYRSSLINIFFTLSSDQQELTIPTKPVIAESKISRFPLIETTGARSSSDAALTHLHSYRYKRQVKASTDARLKILNHGGTSAAIAAVEGGWYYKTGCCASISQSGSNTRIVYYIPHVGPMSIGKKIAYIKELEK